MYCRDTRSENTGTLPISTPGVIVTSCSRITRMGTSTPYGARNGWVQTPVATTTVSAAISAPSANCTPATLSRSISNLVTLAP